MRKPPWVNNPEISAQIKNVSTDQKFDGYHLWDVATWCSQLVKARVLGTLCLKTAPNRGMFTNCRNKEIPHLLDDPAPQPLQAGGHKDVVQPAQDGPGWNWLTLGEGGLGVQPKRRPVRHRHIVH